jgi:hypothetical protein
MSDFLNPHLQRPAIRWDTASALPEVESSGKAMPLLCDAVTGRLLVDLPSYSDPSTTNGLLHSIEADIVAVKDDTASIAANSFDIPSHSYRVFNYTSGALTSIGYYAGGSPSTMTGGTLVKTKYFSYSGNNITGIGVA